MLSLNDLHSQLDELLNINSDESTITKELYTDLINEQRSLLIRNEYGKNRSVDPNVKQELPCLEVEIVSPTTCCVSLPGCKNILRTKKRIPSVIEFSHKSGIISVGPTNILFPRYSFIEYARVPYVGNGRTTSQSIYSFLYDGYLWIFCKDFSKIALMENITTEALFDDPTELSAFINCSTGTSCWSPDKPYPMKPWMWLYAKEQIKQQLGPKLGLPLDESNNAKDDKINVPTK